MRASDKALYVPISDGLLKLLAERINRERIRLDGHGPLRVGR